ncbi:MAG: hypothetical protein GY876_09635 [Planctomycetes bacterium]|nr:hypothetical protein [Planctomycetota bacterium]
MQNPEYVTDEIPPGLEASPLPFLAVDCSPWWAVVAGQRLRSRWRHVVRVVPRCSDRRRPLFADRSSWGLEWSGQAVDHDIDAISSAQRASGGWDHHAGTAGDDEVNSPNGSCSDLKKRGLKWTG